MTNPKPRRKNSLRLRGYDYSSVGAYFVTIVTWQREMLFGKIVGDEMVLNEMGEIVRDEWERTPIIRPNVELGAYIVMPNHFHGIVIITDSDDVSAVGAHSCAPLPKTGVAYRKPKSLGAIMAGFKSSVTKRINTLHNSPGVPVWQRNYHDRIIRNEREMSRIWDYIDANPARWDDDDENPRNW
jgi:putative transposase